MIYSQVQSQVHAYLSSLEFPKKTISHPSSSSMDIGICSRGAVYPQMGVPAGILLHRHFGIFKTLNTLPQIDKKKKDNMKTTLQSATLVLTLSLLSSCNLGGNLQGSASPSGHTPAVLGILQVEIDPLGQSSTQFIPFEAGSKDLSSQAVNYSGTAGLAFSVLPFNSSFNNAGSQYFSRSFEITNNTGATITNLSLWAAEHPTRSLGGSSLYLKDTFGTLLTGASNEAIVRGVLPTHLMKASPFGVDGTEASLQYYTPVETAKIKQELLTAFPTSLYNPLGYGFMSHLKGSASRTIAAGATATIAMSFKSPSAVAKYGFNFLVVKEDEVSNTQSLEEIADNSSVVTRANVLAPASTKIRTPFSSTLADARKLPICNILTAQPSVLNPSQVYLDGQSGGVLDACFGVAGLVITAVPSGVPSSKDDGLDGLVLQSDGKIVAVGFVAGKSNNNIIPDLAQKAAIIRYTSTGAVDTTFNTTGYNINVFGSTFSQFNAVALQPDGKLVAVGYAGAVVGNGHILVARYTSTGILDNTFGDVAGLVRTGYTITTIGSIFDQGQAVALQSDNKIVVAGITNSATGNDTALVRYSTDGTLDTTFDGDGKKTASISAGDDQANGVVIQSDGNIVVAGSSNTDFMVARFNTAGALDTAGFASPNGYMITSLSANIDKANALALQTDGKIVTAGYAGGITGVVTGKDVALVRYNSNGSLDSGFGTAGIKIQNIAGLASQEDEARSVLVQNGKIVIGGVAYTNGTNRNDFVIARFTAAGALDTTFNTTGIVRVDHNSVADVANGIVAQPDGKYVLAGIGKGNDFDFGLMRFWP